MARLNPDIAMIDDGQEQPRRVIGPRNDTSQISEEDMYKASRDAAIELGVDPLQLAREAGAAGDYSGFNKLSPAEKAAFQEGRSEQQTQERKFGTEGNPQPYEPPPGANWNLYGDTWKLYYKGAYIGDANGYDQKVIDAVNAQGQGGGGSGGGGGGGGGGGNTSLTTPLVKTAEQIATETKAAQDKEKRQSAYDLLYSEFERYGLASLVTPLKDLITSGVSPSEFTLKLRETDAYKNRFAANQSRVKNGLRALSEAEYIRNEDAYQEVMRRRGLPASYYEQTVDPVTGITKQKGFEALLAGDVSSTELEDRIVTAQDRVINANPEIAAQLKQFYPGISNGDILAYTLDPANAINQIKRKITAAEIGAAAGTYGLGTTVGRAEQLAGAGVTEATAQQGFKTISQVGPRAGVLAQYYKQDPYTQETAEREFFGLTGAREAEMQRKKLASLETAEFSGSAGAGAIARDRAGVL
jgi:hypothetical protein